MAYIFFLLGLIGVLLGGYLTFSVLSAAPAGSPAVTAAMVMALGVPLGIMVTGFIFLAIGEVLARLAEIDRNTRRAAAAAKITANHIQRTRVDA